jgi:hypothetical protein
VAAALPTSASTTTSPLSAVVDGALATADRLDFLRHHSTYFDSAGGFIGGSSRQPGVVRGMSGDPWEIDGVQLLDDVLELVSNQLDESRGRDGGCEIDLRLNRPAWRVDAAATPAAVPMSAPNSTPLRRRRTCSISLQVNAVCGDPPPLTVHPGGFREHDRSRDGHLWS